MTDLLARAEVLKTRNRFLMTVPGSGYHDNDRYPARPEKLMAPQNNGLPPVSEHLIAFFGEDDVKFVGEDAFVAMSAIQKWYDENEIRDPWSLSGTEAKMIRFIPMTHIQEIDGVSVLALRRDRWNDYLWVLDKMKIGLTGNPEIEAEHGA